MPLNQLAGGVERKYSKHKTRQNCTRSASVRSRAFQVMAEGIAESGVGAGIETGAYCIRGQETEPAGAGCTGKGRHYRVQPWDELGQHDKRKPIPGKGLFRPAIVGVRVLREAVNEV